MSAIENDKTSTVESTESRAISPVKKEDPENALSTVVKPSEGKENQIVDAVWGTIDEDGPNYRNLGW